MSAKEKAYFLTPEGKRKLEEELEYLRTVKRPQVAEQIHQAKADGDISENAGYDEAKTAQAFLEGRILTLEKILENAIVIEKQGPSDSVMLGSKVTVLEEGQTEPETYLIVGSAEADPLNGRISNESPLGQALMGAKVGDTVVVHAPAGEIRFKVVSIE
ncbi:MAG: transcription elongation factor GreA [Chloroflexi bacterium]|nr:MAG: transcription elongation factor GreA [Chloroflexota bacterium]HDN79018.1 transcription elongation factor GreA [Chloroflexota bacterium]